MKFTIERIAWLKMLKLTRKKATGATRLDKFARLSACNARVFIEANACAGGLEALVVAEGTCFVPHELLLNILKTYAPRTHLVVEADLKSLRVGTTKLAIRDYSETAVPPFSYKTFNPAALAQEDFKCH